MNFETFWLSGPWRKIGKDLARRRWNKTVKTPEDLAAITSARDRYRQELQRRFKHRAWDETVILHGGTFFGLWQDYAELATDDRAYTEIPRCDYCKSDKHGGSDCEERRRDYAELQARIKVATGKMAMGGKV